MIFLILTVQESAAKKQKELENAQENVESSKKELDTVTDVLLNEFEKFKAEKAVDIKALLANFAHMQASIIDYNCNQHNIT